MGFYDEQAVPRAVDLMLGTKAFGHFVRAATGEGLQGEVIELGFDSGLNMPYYPAEVANVTRLVKGPQAWSYAYIGRARNPG